MPVRIHLLYQTVVKLLNIACILFSDMKLTYIL
jgi:hypothetical protein